MRFDELLYSLKSKLCDYFGLEPPMLPSSRIRLEFNRISDTEVLVKRYDKKTNIEVYQPFTVTTLSEKAEKRLEKLLKERNSR